MKTVRIIGVPEHFNLPWHLAIEEGAFEEKGINLQWTDIPEGTGRMCQMLQDNATDVAIILTEGLIKSITAGNPSKIVQEFIGTPLQWGIHVASNSDYKALKELKDTKAAISRFGSGSHLMAYVNAQNQSWDTGSLQFEIVHHLDGAIEALTKGQADYFMWEHFTTKPLVDNGTFRRLGDCPTPWPCFVIAATEKFIAEENNVLQHLLEIINLYTGEFKTIPSIDRTLANRYRQQLTDIQEWLSMTRWSQSQIASKTVREIQETLMKLDLIDTLLGPDAILV
ncbi:ABC transporter substrate-binding protein [Aggregatimonas sangjinii]|uniref:ABC transporter substrate-binding protein n=1 Tax=Aggregatimonas sangjinii TaxID=2583587 RepID=A0A5B7ST05_9FLAO|nr:substrate-binding domain-containing protein [Aggregatimonas sangjinii]QCW99979.1 ABC transporter substrate-binding protein [Aggregatimonas sangjinii]